jgi:cytoskeletal protein CcmA (bactofilin family)
MFGKKESKQRSIESLVGVGMVIEGNVTFKGGMRVDGMVRGDVRAADGASSMLVISEQARIEGEVHAAHIVVNGSISGTVHVTELIELQPKARITGDVFYHALEMHQGAVVDGRLMHADASKAAPAVAPAEPVLKLAANGQ